MFAYIVSVINQNARQSRQNIIDTERNTKMHLSQVLPLRKAAPKVSQEGKCLIVKISRGMNCLPF